MRGVLVWTGGIAASVVLNGGLAAFLAAAVAPDPQPAPRVPDRQFDIASYPVPQTRAPQLDATGAVVPEAAAGGTRSSGRAVPQARAGASALPAERAPIIAASGPGLAPETPVGAALAPVAPRQVGLAPRAVVGQPARASAIAGAPVAALLAPGAVVSATPATGAALRPAAPTGAALAALDAPPLAILPLAVGGEAMVPVAPRQVGLAPRAVVGQPAQASAIAGAPVAALVAPGAVVSATPATGAALRPAAPTGAALSALDAPPLAIGPLIARGETLVRVASPSNPPLPASAPATEAARPVMALVVPTHAGLPRATPLAASAPTAPDAPSLAVASTVAPALTARVVPASFTPLAPVTGMATPATAPTPIALRQQGAAGTTIEQTSPPTTAAPSVRPTTERQSAALAWSGAAAAALDPVSLAAIQAFAQAGDPAGDGPRVRDAISGLLAQVPCARLQTVFDPATGALELRGHIPDPGLRAPVLAALSAQLGGAILLADATLILPRPQCDALAGVEAVGLPQSDEQVGDPRVIGERPFAAQWGFAAGEVLEFEMEAPDYPAYVYVDYFQSDGQVFHLQPSDLVPLRAVAPHVMFRTGSRGDGLPKVRFLISPPFGQEIMVAFASSAPLYDGLRPMAEPAAPYLEFLRGAVAQARAKDPAFRGEWYYFFVTTRP